MIRNFKPGQEKTIRLLIKSVFDEFIGHEYSEEGNKNFNNYIFPREILSRFKKGNIILTYIDANNIVGIIEVRDNNHICLFFVKKEYHNTGIGRLLLNSTLEKIKDKTNFIEVNASPYSEKIYAKLGFRKTCDLTEKDGIKFIPMIMELK